MDAMSPGDIADTGTGTGTMADTGSFTTATNDEMIHVVVEFANPTATEVAGTGYSMNGDGYVSGFLATERESDSVNTAGSNSATMTWTGRLGISTRSRISQRMPVEPLAVLAPDAEWGTGVNA